MKLDTSTSTVETDLECVIVGMTFTQIYFNAFNKISRLLHSSANIVVGVNDEYL